MNSGQSDRGREGVKSIHYEPSKLMSQGSFVGQDSKLRICYESHQNPARQQMSEREGPDKHDRKKKKRAKNSKRASLPSFEHYMKPTEDTVEN